MSFCVDVITKKLEETPISIIPILESLYHNNAAIDTCSAVQQKHLYLRCLNLAKAHDTHKRWCGINLLKVLCYNYNILVNEGTNTISHLLKILETYNHSISKTILTSTVDCINSLCEQIRGKPSLTREVLTPKLPTIIVLYLENLFILPQLIISSLKVLLENHPTTFRPYGNKLKSKLLFLLSLKEAKDFPLSLVELISDTIAALIVIERNDPQVKWMNELDGLFVNITQTLSIYNELLNTSEDSAVKELFNKLEVIGNTQEKYSFFEFEPLNIDVNESSTIFEISRRVQLLLGLITSFLTTETQFSVSVNIGKLVLMSELICALNPHLISVKNDIRGYYSRQAVLESCVMNQRSVIKSLTRLTSVYRGSFVTHLNGILSFLETLVPSSGRSIDYNFVGSHEYFYCELLECVGSYLNLVSYLGDPSAILKFFDVAMVLVEPKGFNSLVPQATRTNGISTVKKSAPKKKNKQQAPLADLLIQESLFKREVPVYILETVNRFFETLITKITLPTTQYSKLMNYLILEAVSARSKNLNSEVPQSLKSCLLKSVLNPGSQKISVLPIVSSLLSDDPLLSVFNHPRFPPLLQYNVQASESSESDEELPEEEVAEHAKAVMENEAEPQSSKSRPNDDATVFSPKKRTKLEESEQLGTGPISDAPSVEKVKDCVIKDDKLEQVHSSVVTTSEAVNNVTEGMDLVTPSTSSSVQKGSESKHAPDKPSLYHVHVHKSENDNQQSEITFSQQNRAAEASNLLTLQHAKKDTNGENSDSDVEIPSIDIGESDDE